PEEVKALMAASDIFFLPSEHEGISLACYEAMAMGLPIVGSDVGGQRELITSDCGFLVQKNEYEIACYLEALRKVLKSPELREKMKSAARCRVEQHFRLSDMGKSMAL